MANITSIEGIGAASADKLVAAGIKSTEALLDKAATKKGRATIAAASGLNAKSILSWANKADLMRVKGIGEEYSDLLEAAGVDTVPALARRNPDNLASKLTEINEVKKLTRRAPTVNEVTGWVAQAKELPRVLKY